MHFVSEAWVSLKLEFHYKGLDKIIFSDINKKNLVGMNLYVS
jgi:hypothetical protein